MVLENAIQNAKNSPDSKAMKEDIQKAKHLMDRLKKLHPITKLDPSTFSEIRRYTHPTTAVRDVLTATYLLLGHDVESVKVRTSFIMVCFVSLISKANRKRSEINKNIYTTTFNFYIMPLSAKKKGGGGMAAGQPKPPSLAPSTPAPTSMCVVFFVCCFPILLHH